MKRKSFLKWALAGLGSYIGGGLMNKLVMWANGGFMPVAYHGRWDWPFQVTNMTHCTMSSDASLKYLADYISFRGWLYSPGDVMIVAGAISMLTFVAVLCIIGYVKLD
ncbi:Uncharacterised protein [uncultured archaeon]|nr:Uncharacterised protein [uncultured archaeon]